MARDYAKFSPRFWTGDTGRKIRGNRDAQVLAAYLISAPGSTMTGIYYLPLPVVAHEVGMTIGVVAATLDILSKFDFAHYDVDTELVWLPGMAAWQIGEELQATDNRVKGIKRELASVGRHRFIEGFWERYSESFSLGPLPPLLAPYKGLRSQEHDQDQEKDQDQEGSRRAIRGAGTTARQDASEHAGSALTDADKASALADRAIAAASAVEVPRRRIFTGVSLAQLFGTVRSRVIGGMEWQGSRVKPDVAANRAAEIQANHAEAEVEATMETWWKRVKAGEVDDPEKCRDDDSFAFGAWWSKFRGLREQALGISPVVAEPASRGPPRIAADVRIGHARAEDFKHKGGGTDHEF